MCVVALQVVAIMTSMGARVPSQVVAQEKTCTPECRKVTAADIEDVGEAAVLLLKCTVVFPITLLTVGTFVGRLMQKGGKLWVVPHSRGAAPGAGKSCNMSNM